MSKSFTIQAVTRSTQGRGANRRLRKQGLVPAIIYGGETGPVMATLNHNEIIKHLEHEAFYSHILSLNLDGKVESVVLKDLQRHPAKPVILHLDLQRVSSSNSIKMLIPIHFINEDKCPGIKKGGTITRSITEVEVVCLPKDLPEHIEVDLSNVDIGHSVHVHELPIPQGVAISHHLSPNAPVVSVHGVRGGTNEEA